MNPVVVIVSIDAGNTLASPEAAFSTIIAPGVDGMDGKAVPNTTATVVAPVVMTWLPLCLTAFTSCVSPVLNPAYKLPSESTLNLTCPESGADGMLLDTAIVMIPLDILVC